MMQSCAASLGKYSIRCNAILPDTIDTRMNADDLRNKPKRESMEERISLGRIGKPENIVGPVLFLASEMKEIYCKDIRKTLGFGC